MHYTKLLFSLSIEVQVPSDPEVQSRYWFVGCFQGQDGLRKFTVKNKLLDINPNYQPNLCV